METLLNYAAEIVLLIFLIITFFQSGIDKIFDWKGNVSWLKEHFSKTFFKDVVPLLLFIVLVTEVVAGILCTIGVYNILALGTTSMALYGALLCSLALLMLLFGQRVAKDYEGARTIVVYFIPTVFLIFLLQA
ncbi:DoxX family membrane protein [Maribacter thermophilus]|uniref:DoxX family membrane protein n=1 Tax=Maribacter thermophilus TaxID=1197874 RepID=UPI00064178E0|nr:DoxX family membrane protein [Maribacter thermophilus]